MLKEIKIIDDNENEIMIEKENLVTIPINGKNEFVSTCVAENLIKIIRGQLNILEAEKIVRKTGDGKHKENINRKTGCSIRGAE